MKSDLKMTEVFRSGKFVDPDLTSLYITKRTCYKFGLKKVHESNWILLCHVTNSIFRLLNQLIHCILDIPGIH